MFGCIKMVVDELAVQAKFFLQSSKHEILLSEKKKSENQEKTFIILSYNPFLL